MNRNYIIAGASGLSLGLGIGLAAGIYIAQKKFETKYADLAKQEIAEAKEFYSALHKTDKFETPESAVDELGLRDAVDALQKYQGNYAQDDEINPDETTDEDDADEDEDEDEDEDDGKPGWVSSLTIPVNSEDDFDYDQEIKTRSPEMPYVISKEEYFQNDESYDQVSYTYYVGDDALADEMDKAVDDVDEVVGENNLVLFGHGSGDPHIVYIRNEKIKLDIEVVLSRGKFTEEVLGFIQHENRHSKTRRFRGDDE